MHAFPVQFIPTATPPPPKPTKKLPLVVRTCLIILDYLANNRSDERGYSVYFKDRDFIVLEDVGEGFLTTSQFMHSDRIDPDVLPFLLTPTAVYLMHTHPFQEKPSPSQLDLDTAQRFRDYYDCPVYCIVVGRRGRRWY